MLWGKPKILIVEDQLRNHELYKDAFGGEGFEVMIFGTAEGDFVDNVIAFSPDIIAMDIMIAKEGEADPRDGFEAIKLLKGDFHTEGIPVIVLTNFFEDSKVNMAKSLGVVDYINLQGQTITSIAKTFKSYVDHPRRYKPSHPAFRSG